MSSTTRTTSGPLAHVVSPRDRSSAAPARRGRHAPSRAFARALAIHLSRTPAIAIELAHWRKCAESIPSRALRQAALASLMKRGNIEGAALFATLAPARRRRTTTRALIAYQAAYNYLDARSEQPSPDPVANAEQLHQALLVALDPDAEHADYYRHDPERDDGGYLTAMLDRCRHNLAQLPSFHDIAPHALAAAARIADFQTLTTAAQHGDEHGLRAWAQQLTAPRSGLLWWETAAAAGSSLPLYALIAAAAHPETDLLSARQIEHAYFPELAALHSLLDSTVDREEDRRQGQPSLLEHYGSGHYASIQIIWLAGGAARALTELPDGPRHRVILAAMASYYLTAPDSDPWESRRLTEGLGDVLGPQLRACIHLFNAKRFAQKLTGARHS